MQKMVVWGNCTCKLEAKTGSKGPAAKPRPHLNHNAPYAYPYRSLGQLEAAQPNQLGVNTTSGSVRGKCYCRSPSRTGTPPDSAREIDENPDHCPLSTEVGSGGNTGATSEGPTTSDDERD